MKLLLCVDLHCQVKAIESLRKKVRKEKPDAICCSGDISIVDRGTGEMLGELDKLGKRFLIIPGNHEDEKNLEMACGFFENMVYLHKKSHVIGNVLFLGYGTGGFSTVDTRFKRVGKDFERIIAKNKGKKIVLLVHAPPYKTIVDNVMGSSCGNKTFKEFIVRNKPDLVVCGHLHENAGKEDFVGKTRAINPGALGVLVEV